MSDTKWWLPTDRRLPLDENLIKSRKPEDNYEYQKRLILALTDMYKDIVNSTNTKRDLVDIDGTIGDLSGTLDDIDDGTTYARVVATALSAGSVLLSQAVGALDDIANGVTYGKVLLSDLDGGHIILGSVVGDLDDVDDGSTYGKILLTDISAGHILLASAEGDLDDIDDGGTYAKVLATDISAGHILLSTTTGDLDDISDGTNYGRIAITDISSGHILLATTIGDLDDISDGTNYGRILSTDISSGHIILSESIGTEKYTELELVNLNGCSIEGNTVTKTNATTAWDSSVYSREATYGGAQCSAKAGQVDKRVIFGLNTDPTTDNNYTSIDYAWYFVNDSSVAICESGLYIAAYGAYTTDTVLSIVYDGANVRYLKDGVVQRTVSASANLKLYFDTSFHYEGAILQNIRFSQLTGSYTLDDIYNGTTYARVQAAVLDSGYLYLLRRSADQTERIEITASGVEQYTNNVKMIELASGILYLGDQSNEHIKISSSGMDIKDGSTVLANYGSTITIGQVTTNQNNILISSGAMYFRNNTDNIIEIANDGTGTLVLKEGSDLFLIGDDTNPAKITHKNTTGTAYVEQYFDVDTSVPSISFYNIPDATWGGYMEYYIGTTLYKFANIQAYAKNIYLQARYDPSDYAQIAITSGDNTSDIELAVVRNGTSKVIYFDDLYDLVYP